MGRLTPHLNLQFDDTMAAAIGSEKLLDTYRDLNPLPQAALTLDADAIDQSALKYEAIIEAIDPMTRIT